MRPQNIFWKASSIWGIFALAVVVGIGSSWAQDHTSGLADDAAVIYAKAEKIVGDDDAKNILAPAASSMNVRSYPPMSNEWVQMEKRDYDLHGRVRELVHEAAPLDHAAWPVFDRQKDSQTQFVYLNELRNLANEIGDASLYQSVVLNDQPAAFQSAADLLHMADLLRSQPSEVLVQMLVAEGIDAIATYRIMMMMSVAKITENPADTHDLPLATARQWIARLLDHPDAQADLAQGLRGEPAGAALNPITSPSLNRILETSRRHESERDLAAMSLAAHVYQFKHGRWPQSLSELATELPRVPMDPWGNGKQTLGYTLIKGGLPDGNDRPLVYSRCLSKDGLFFRIDHPQYSFYNSDGSLPVQDRKNGGQFRDVASWVPAEEGKKVNPTTEPLP
jgi:hypothetical protein